MFDISCPWASSHSLPAFPPRVLSVSSPLIDRAPVHLLHSSPPFARKAMHVSQSRDQPLWVNRNPTASYMWKFLQIINTKYNQNLSSYDDLYAWSIDCLPQFWEEVWAFTGVQAVSRRAENGGGLTNGYLSDEKPFKHVSGILVCQVITLIFPQKKFFS
jgi:hypothetical protein